MLWEIESIHVSHNQLIAKMTKEELLERNKDYKPGETPSSVMLMKLKLQKESDAIALKTGSVPERLEGPTYKVVECQKQPTES